MHSHNYCCTLHKRPLVPPTSLRRLVRREQQTHTASGSDLRTYEGIPHLYTDTQAGQNVLQNRRRRSCWRHFHGQGMFRPPVFTTPSAAAAAAALLPPPALTLTMASRSSTTTTTTRRLPALPAQAWAAAPREAATRRAEASVETLAGMCVISALPLIRACRAGRW